MKFVAGLFSIIGSFITISCNSLLIGWVGLELNLISFIPLMMMDNNHSSDESSMKYFLVQALTSIMFLISILFLNYHFLEGSNMSHEIFSLIMSGALYTKLGSMPFHFWLFPLINYLSWSSFISLVTWQKIAPLFILTYFYSNLLIWVISLSALFSPVFMLNQNSMKMMFGYASIIHTAWLAFIGSFSMPMMSLYFASYLISFIPIYYMMTLKNLVYFSQMILFPGELKIFFFLMSLSLSGFPPMSMFMMKITVVFEMMKLDQYYFLTFLLLLSSLSACYSYLYINFPFFMSSVGGTLVMKTSSHSLSLLVSFSSLFGTLSLGFIFLI